MKSGPGAWVALSVLVIFLGFIAYMSGLTPQFKSQKDAANDAIYLAARSCGTTEYTTRYLDAVREIQKLDPSTSTELGAKLENEVTLAGCRVP